MFINHDQNNVKTIIQTYNNGKFLSNSMRNTINEGCWKLMQLKQQVERKATSYNIQYFTSNRNREKKYKLHVIEFDWS